MNDNYKEIYRVLQTSQDKYIYFILATTVAAIGFTITQTNSLKLSVTQIPVAFSLICWGISFWSGCRNREYYNSVLYANSDLIRIQSGQYPGVGNHPEMIEAASDGIKSAINKNSDRIINLGKLQLRLFILGAIFFILWRVIEMYMRT